MPRPTGSPLWPRRSRPPIDVLTHPALARLHPTGGHPESSERLAVLLEAFPDAREGHAAERTALERVHATEYLDVLATLREPHWFDPDTVASETSWTAALLAAGTAIEAAETGSFALVRPSGDRRLRRPSRERHAGDLLGRRHGSVRLAPSVAFLSGHRWSGRATRD